MPFDPQAGIAVCLLEDHPIVRDALVQVLTSSGIQVLTTAAQPDRFFAEAPNDRGYVAILDLILDANGGHRLGRDVLKRLTSDYPMVRSVIFTADRSQAMRLECEKLGAWGYMDKATASASDVVETVRRVASGQRAFPAAEAFGDDPKIAKLMATLSPRERHVLSFISGGADNLKIASHLGITERTVRAHVSSLYRKLGSENRTQLALLARQLGIDPPSTL